ncbi:hypothetical protein BC940DRAFT_334235 [Gongronella butleri]|nr:hypothetical protein BC940DRAFT_334235 [Gongronella butleri]
MPRFQPKAPKQVAVADASKKLHVKFDDSDDDAQGSGAIGAVNTSQSSGSSESATIRPAIQGKDGQHASLSSVPAKRGAQGDHAAPLLPKHVRKKQKEHAKANAQLDAGAKQAAREAKALAKRDKHRQKMNERRMAKKLAKSGGVDTPLALLHLTPDAMPGFVNTQQLRDLVYYCVLADAPSPPFCHITRKSLVQRLVVLYADDFDVSWMHVDRNNAELPRAVALATVPPTAAAKANMPNLVKAFDHMFLTDLRLNNMRYSTKPLAGLLQAPLSANRKDILKQDMNKRVKEGAGDRYALYTLTLEQMRDAGYPIPPSLDPSVTLPEDWKETRPGVGGKKRLMAVDCEMVLTTKGRALARVSIVGEDGEVVLDEFVKPEDRIVDYLTEFSGITREIMEATQCSLRRAQKHVRKLVDHDVLLVGHSLDQDLKALQLAHPVCADTSLLYDSARGIPFQPSLRGLTKTMLHRKIQEHRHDSVQDANASLDLFKLKVERGPKFGRHGVALELIFDRLKRSDRTSRIMQSLPPACPNTFQSALGNMYQRYDTDEKLVEAIVAQCRDQNFLLAQFQSKSIYEHGQTGGGDDDDENGDNIHGSVPTVVSATPDQDPLTAKRAATLDAHFKTIYDALPTNTAIVVLGGIGQDPHFHGLLKRFLAFEQRRRSKTTIGEPIEWSVDDQKELDRLYNKVRHGACFVTLKT